MRPVLRPVVGADALYPNSYHVDPVLAVPPSIVAVMVVSGSTAPAELERPTPTIAINGTNSFVMEARARALPLQSRRGDNLRIETGRELDWAIMGAQVVESGHEPWRSSSLFILYSCLRVFFCSRSCAINGVGRTLLNAGRPASSFLQKRAI